MMGVDGTRNAQSDIAKKYRLHIVTSRWTFIDIDLRCTEP